MSEDPDFFTIHSEFHTTEYVEVADEAAKRTRWLTVVVIVASVIIFIGFWNSIQWSWATERLKASFDLDRKGIFLMVKDSPDTNIDEAAYRRILQDNVVRAYVDNVRFIHIPVFGIAIEINDLGLIGSIALIIILVLLRFSLSREIKNLNILFRESVRHRHLSHFYHKLAMRQVFTIPEMKGEEKNYWLSVVSKIVYLLPFIAIGTGIGYDYYSIFGKGIYPALEVLKLLIIELVCLVIVLYLCLRCLERQLHIDDIWEDFWVLVSSGKREEFLITETEDQKIAKIVDMRIINPRPEDGRWIKHLLRHFRRIFSALERNETANTADKASKS